MPPYFEESLVLYGAQHRELTENSSGLFVNGRRISDATAEKYRRFAALVDRTAGHFDRAVPDILREMPDSYFSYYVSQQSGIKHE
jgi:hypothetical protein